MEQQSMEKKTLKKGEVIFQQGKYEEWMFDILQGRVGIFAEYGTENEKKVAEMEAGSFFGEMGMIECYPRSATAVCMEDDTCIQKISQADFGAYFKEHPDRIYTIMQQLGSRIRKTTEDYLQLCQAAEGAENGAGGAGGAGSEVGEKGGLMARLKAFGSAHLPAAEGKPGEYKKGDVIFREGDEEPFMYDIQHGTVGIYGHYGTPQQTLLAELGESDFVGEMGLIEARPRSATAVALETGTRLQAVDAETFDDYFRERPAKVLMLMQQMSGRLREVSKKYLDEVNRE
ncbi:MAG: Crp/Fnr family transcriptional regulator [Anaerovoracaceae bacterium]